MSAVNLELTQHLVDILRTQEAGDIDLKLSPPVQEALIDHAQDHGVGPLCYERICGSALIKSFDTELLARLHIHTVAETVLDTHRQRCLREVLTALGKAGINSLVFKGSALAQTHYSQTYLRPRDDNDILVAHHHLTALNTILSRLGFQRTVTNQQDLILRQYLYWRRDSNGCLHNLDIHWALNNRQGLGDKLNLTELRIRASPLHGLGEFALAPHPVDAVLIACLHLAAHHAGEIRLIWLYDLHLLIEAMSTEELKRLADEIQRLDLVQACSLGLGLAAFYFSQSGSKFEILGAEPLDPETVRAPRRIEAWQADLSALPSMSLRIRYLSQHLIPNSRYMLRRAGKTSSLWLPWLYVLRAGRGVQHLLRP